MTTFLSRLGAKIVRGHGRLSTVDAAKAAPPPSPLAPVDLTDPAQVTAALELAARIGEILLSSGTSNSDTKTQIHAVTSAYGLHYTHVDITLNTITLHTAIGEQRRTPVNVFRVVRNMTTDFSRLSEVDRLIRSIQAGATPPEVAEKILDQVASTPASYGLATSILGWGIMGGAISIMLGGGWLVGLTSFLTSVLIMGVNAVLSRYRLPMFFQNVFGGFIATIPAAVSFEVAAQQGVAISPSQIIASGIIVLLAGLTLVQSLQDGITGAPVTASARFFQTLLYTGAIVAGVAIGIQVSGALGISLPPMSTLAAPNAQTVAAQVICGGVASAGFAIACYAEWSSVWLSGVTGLAGAFFYHLVFLPFGVGAVFSAALAAGVIGLAGGLLARRFLIPPLITGIAGITPMLPGLSVYRSMYAALNEQMLVGFTNMAVALATACALAAGVVLGEWIARRIRRPRRFNPYRAFRAAGRVSFQRLARAAAQTRRRSRRARSLQPGTLGGVSTSAAVDNYTPADGVGPVPETDYRSGDSFRSSSGYPPAEFYPSFESVPAGRTARTDNPETAGPGAAGADAEDFPAAPYPSGEGSTTGGPQSPDADPGR
ncbi:threonine/serine exporter ThrE [Corynebacterium halotolerans]|uniref:threonine/serine exporter ThrE n=1 Tax=Corynebacterium halotolerans TaxID=225326 RepID=UPI003CF79CE8